MEVGQAVKLLTTSLNLALKGILRADSMVKSGGSNILLVRFESLPALPYKLK
jgi:hypothetical protein